MQGALLKDRYLLQDLLGEGAMGQVFRAVDTHTRDVVAVKVLTESARRDPKLLRTLWREVRAVARMLHPNIVQVMDYGQAQDDSPFLVMEYVPGRGFDAWRGRLSVRDLVETIDGVLAALAYAHARGVVHLDLKPENILVVEGRDGSLQPKLVDFGVAHVRGGADTEADVTLASQATAGMIVGTPAYMSPEQAQGNNRIIGPESDLYALGVMLYEFLVGVLPFDAANTMGMLFQHVSKPPPPLVPPPGVYVPPALSQVVMRLLEKKQEARFGFAADVRRALRKLDWSGADDQAAGDPDALGQAGGLVTAPGEGDRLPWMETVAASSVMTAAVEEDRDGLQTVFSSHSDVLDLVPANATVAPGLFGLREQPLIGRETERTVLWRAIEAALEERSVSVVVLQGPSGVGSSRLARWACERAEEEGLARAVMFGVGEDTVLPSGGLRALLERQLRLQGLARNDCGPALREQLVASGDFGDHELVPLLDYLRPDASRRDLSAGAAVDPVAIVARYLRVATHRRPVVLWVDDLRGSDAAAALDLVEFLLATRNIAPLPIAVVVTVGDEPGSEVTRRLEEATEDDGVRVVSMTPLSQTVIARLVMEMLPVSERLALTVAERSEGNPGVAVQILSHWLEREDLVDEGDGQLGLASDSMSIRQLPSGLSDLLRTRLQAVLALCPDRERAREILWRAAVTGRRFRLQVLERTLADEGRLDLVEDLDAVWDRLIENDLWIEVEEGIAQFGRAELHELARDHMARAADRMRYHGLVAEAMLTLFSDRLAESHREIAEHLEASGQYDRACDHQLAAGQQALAWARFDVALAAFRGAQTIMAGRTLSAAMRVADEIDLGMALWAVRTGAYDQADAHLAAVFGRMQAGARQRVLARAAQLRAELTQKRGELELAAERFREAASRFESVGDAQNVANSLQGLADVLLFCGRYDDASTAAAQARDLHDDPWSAARCLVIEGKVARSQLRIDDAHELYAAAADAFERAGDPHGVAEARTGIGGLLRHTGKLDEACALFEDLLVEFTRLGDPNNVAVVRRALGSLYDRLGRLPEADAEYRAALQVSTGLGDKLGEARALNGLGEIARKQERWTDAVHYYDAYIGAAESLGAEVSSAIGWANLGLTHAERQHWDAARDAFRRAVEIARRIGNREYLCGFLATLGHACARLECWGESEEAIDEALNIDAEVRSTQPDFLLALESYARIACTVTPDLAKRALGLVAERWRALGNDEAAQRALAVMTGE